MLTGMRILLADDAEASRILLLSCLQRAHAAIEVAENGAAAVELFRLGRYDVVLMDVEMPVMDGIDATRQIRRFESATGFVPTPVLALTAHTLAEMTVRATGAGFTGVLIKPILNAALLEAVMQFRPTAIIPAQPPAETGSEPDMHDLARAYMDRKRADIRVYRQALESADFEAIKQLGHKMKGTGTGYGFPMLTELGRQIEQAALNADGRRVLEVVDRFARYVEGIPQNQMTADGQLTADG
jgi:CheY-like chemotaxis protein